MTEKKTNGEANIAVVRKEKFKNKNLTIISIEDALSENFVTIDIDSKNYHTTSEVGDWLSKRVSEYLS